MPRKKKVKKEKKYQINNLNINQLKIIKKALEVITRLYSGQWDMAFDEIFRYGAKPLDDKWREMDKNDRMFYELIYLARKIIFPELSRHAGYGVCCNEKTTIDMTTAFDMIQVIRQMSNNDERKPCHFDKGNELIFCKEE